mmetsp:Transcript_15119/g.18061  ORF Transcript_15119/g.18061 Transcript_15119/m.18061 type:complete len:85 (+) Transcript_15119:217-471(+)
MIPVVGIDIEESEKCDSEDEGDDILIKKCRKGKQCGHKCNGAAGEADCLPCLDSGCHEDESRLPDNSELCAICYTSELREEACV